MAALLVPQLLREAHDPVQRALDVRGRRGVGEPHPAVVAERGPGHQRYALLGDEPGAALRVADAPARVRAEGAADRPQRPDALYPRHRLPAAREGPATAA